MAGRSPGRVIWTNCFQRPAPSMVDASYRLGLMPVKAARKIIVPQPTSFHMPEVTMTVLT
ncbi:hypothetical protein D3C80_2194800 [compost metagenome]